MSTLSLALYCEGPTDKRFLPILIQRTSQYVLNQHGKNTIEVLPVEVVDAPKQRQGKSIVEASMKAAGRHVLVIHTDADNRTYEQAKAQSFDPGYNLVQQTREKVCRDLVAMIPVREVEAWMIADQEALRIILGIKMATLDLGLPKKARLVELESNPKITLKQVVAKAHSSRSKRHRDIDWHRFYGALAREINLERLKEVPAYKHFVTDLTATLKTLNLIQ